VSAQSLVASVVMASRQRMQAMTGGSSVVRSVRVSVVVVTDGSAEGSRSASQDSSRMGQELALEYALALARGEG
jgi:hypothetical protein